MKSIDINYSFDPSKGLNICVLQMETPLGKNLFRTIDEYNNRFSWSTESAAAQNKKLHNIFHALSKIVKTRKIDILLFPEYIAPWNARDSMINVSRELGCILVFNYYSTSQRQVISEVICNGTHFEVPKISASVYEQDYIQEGREVTPIKFTLHDTESKTYNIAVLSCLDFIKYSSKYISKDCPTIFLSPIASPTMDQFYSVSANVVSNAPVSYGSNIVCISNNVGSFFTTAKKTLRFCGASSIIGPNIDRNSYPRLDHIHEGCIIATLHPDRKVIQPTPTNISIGCISNPILMIYQDKVYIPSDTIQPSSTYSINPQYIKYSPKINNYYSLCRMRNPIENIRYLSAKLKTGLALYSVYGYHDILVQSLERNPDLFHLRFEVEVESTLQPNQVESKESYEVIDAYKYRGKILKNYVGDETSGILRKNSATRVFEDLFDPKNYPRGLFEEKAAMIRDILLGKTYGKEDELTKMGIFIPSTGSSDLSEDEQSLKIFEILVYIFLIPSEGDFDVYRIFEDSVIRLFMNNTHVRSIERVRPIFTEASAATTLNHLSYVLHYAGSLSEIGHDVYSVISTQLKKYGIDYATRTMIIHEKLTSHKYDSFIESDYSSNIQDIVSSMVLSNRANDNPLLFLRLNSSLLEEIAHYYHSQLIYAKASFQGRAYLAYVNDLSDFVYCIARIHALPYEESTLDELMNLLSPHIAPILNKQFEKMIDIFVERIKRYASYQEQIEYLISHKKVKFSNSEQFTLGDKIQLVIVWHKYIENERLGIEIAKCSIIMNGDEHCNQEKAIEYLQHLQKKKVNIIRNWFSHPPEPGDNSDIKRASAIRDHAYDILHIAIIINKLLMRCMYKIRYSSKKVKKDGKSQQLAAPDAGNRRG